MKTLFISRKVEEEGELAAFCQQHNLQLIALPLIGFKPVIATDIPTTDVLFFTSPRSVSFYLEQAAILPGQQIATVGENTSKALQERGITVDFTGSTPTQPEKIALDFKNWVGSKTVLFPQSSVSNRTMQQALSSHQYTDLVVYETVAFPREILPVPDLLIFSSPSNFRSFLKTNAITNQQILLAFGSTTQNYISECGYSSRVLSGISEEEIIQFITPLLH